MTDRDTRTPHDEHWLVLGMGVTGRSLAAWCAGRGAQATFADSREKPPAAEAIRALLPEAALRAGDLPSAVPDGTTGVVVSPGLPSDLPVIRAARAAGLPVLSDIDLFMEAFEGPVIGVTGSNGKSTVTSLLAAMIRAAGMRVASGGNLGTPALELLGTDADVAVLELSSFQLERSREPELHAAVILNLSPDHLDQHGDMQRYAAAKARIVGRARHVVVNRDAPELEAWLPRASDAVGFTLGSPSPRDWGVVRRDDGQWIARGALNVMPVAGLQIAGQHNVGNALAAFALADTLDLPLDGLVAGAQLFPGLPHRMQRVASRDGIVWIDDSKATNEAAAIASIESVFGSLAGRLVLIAGGDAKGNEPKDLARCLEDRDVLAILLGKDRDMLQRVLGEHCETALVHSIEEAVAHAARIARPGDVVLLAPACSSLDMFENFAARGDAFARAVAGVQS